MAKKKANPALIGGFVVGAIVLLVAGVVAFGSGALFTKTNRYVMFFEGSMSGLRPGAQVAYRGVKVGAVTDIKIVLGQGLEAAIPVYVEIQPGRIEAPGIALSTGEVIPPLIEQGLRTQLKAESFVTGQLYVELDFHKDAPLKLIGKDPTVPEIPTVPSAIDQISKKIEELDLEKLVTAAQRTLEGIDTLVNGPEIRKAVTDVGIAMTELRATVETIRTGTGPVLTALTHTMTQMQASIAELEMKLAETLDAYTRLADGADRRVGEVADAARGTLDEYRLLGENAEKQISPLLADTREAARAARVAMQQGERALGAAQAMLAPNSPLQFELTRALRDISSAARSIAALANDLERNPEQLLRGKGTGRR